MKLTNPNQDRSILAHITPRSLEADPTTGAVPAGEWHEIPPGETVEVEDYVVASTLVEYGAVASPDDLQAARELWAERNRLENSRTASATASEGKILARQQATVDVATGTVSGGELKGEQLAAAVAAANEAGAEIKASATADEKRAALVEWQRVRGVSSPLERVAPDAFQTDEDGNVILDGDGQPIPVAGAGDVDAANAPHAVADPEAEVVASPDQVDGSDDGETLVEDDES